ncbi:MAG: flavodoxin family protein [Chloroflexi bacterium]|nr:flavodoxin family protein [Chloroflexota bacterium]
MKAVFINASPRKNANTHHLTRALAEELAAHFQGEFLDLMQYRVLRCLGDQTCRERKQCCQEKKDDMAMLCERLAGADLIVFGSPVYFSNVSGLAKDFIDRTLPIYYQRLLKGKMGTSLVTNSGEGGLMAEHSLMEFFKLHNMITIRGIVCTGRHPGEAMDREENIRRVKQLAERILEAAVHPVPAPAGS